MVGSVCTVVLDVEMTLVVTLLVFRGASVVTMLVLVTVDVVRRSETAIEINPFSTSRLVHPYHLDGSIFSFTSSCWLFLFLLYLYRNNCK